MVTTGPPSSEHFRMSQRPAKMPGQPPLGSGRWHSHLLGRRGPRGGVSISYFPARLAAYSRQGPWAMLRLSADIARGFSGYTPGGC